MAEVELFSSKVDSRFTASRGREVFKEDLDVGH